MSELLTEEIVKDVGNSWYTLKADGTQDAKGHENISIVIRYLNEKKRSSRAAVVCGNN